MKIAIIGYGKMGKIIEEVALKRGHEIVLIADQHNIAQLTESDFKKADVAIEFTSPHAVIDNIKTCFNYQVPIVVGSTGWYDQLDEIKGLCLSGNNSFLYASNFSIGVNIFFELNKKLAAMMNHQPQYSVKVDEIHHIHKLDSPSGTGITIAEGIIEKLDRKTKWINKTSKLSNELELLSHREGEVPGTHSVTYANEIDEIEIKHTAHSRKGFAEGAVIAAEWLKSKKGFYTMKDVLSL